MSNEIKLTDCKLCKNLGANHVPSSGNSRAELMIVGQSPGATEVEKGEPFVGPCGEVVQFLLDEVHIARREVYIANALKCRPSKNRPGTKEELITCYNTWLKQEIKMVNPKVILLLGKDAWQSVLKGKYIFKHGSVFHGKKRKYLVSYHPSYFIRQGNFADFLKLGPILKELLVETTT